MLKAVKPTSASEQVFEQLRDLIYRGKLRPGQKVAPERELAETLGVSRPTVRGALKKLATLGLIDQRQGQGTFVAASATSASQKNPLARMLGDVEVKVEDLLEVRLALECAAAAQAAQRATMEDIRSLSDTLTQMLSQVGAGELATAEDLAFHMNIAFATKNPVHIRIMKNLYDLLYHGIEESLRELYREQAHLEMVKQQHIAIFEAIRNHDAEAAQNAMRTHITFVCDFFASEGVTPRIRPIAARESEDQIKGGGTKFATITARSTANSPAGDFCCFGPRRYGPGFGGGLRSRQIRPVGVRKPTSVQ